eukprot:403333714
MAVNQSNVFEIDQTASMILKDNDKDQKSFKQNGSWVQNYEVKKGKGFSHQTEIISDIFRNAFFLKERSILTQEEVKLLPKQNCQKYLSDLSDNQKLLLFEIVQLNFIEQTYGPKCALKIIKNIGKNDEKSLEFITKVKDKIIEDGAGILLEEEIKHEKEVREQDRLNKIRLLEEKRKNIKLQQQQNSMNFDKFLKRLDYKRKIQVLDKIEEVYSKDEASLVPSRDSDQSKSAGRTSVIQSIMSKFRTKHQKLRQKLNSDFMSLNQSEKQPTVQIDFPLKFSKTHDFNFDIQENQENIFSLTPLVQDKNDLFFPKLISERSNKSELIASPSQVIQNNEQTYQKKLTQSFKPFSDASFQDFDKLEEVKITTRSQNQGRSSNPINFEDTMIPHKLSKTQNFLNQKVLSVSDIDSLDEINSFEYKTQAAIQNQNLISSQQSDTSYISSLEEVSDLQQDIQLDSEEACQNDVIVDFQQAYIKPLQDKQDFISQRLDSENGVQENEDIVFQQEPHHLIAQIQN